MPKPYKILITDDTVAAEAAKFERGSNAIENIVFDDKDTGFGLRLRRSGRHVWIVQYRIGHQQRRITLGKVSAFDAKRAREKARDHLASARLGDDPQTKKRKEQEAAKRTVGWAVEQFLAAKRPKLRASSFAEVNRYLSDH